MSISRADCASSLELQELQPAELRGLMAALVESEEDPGPLLRAAVKQQLIPEGLRDAPDWTKNIRIVDNIMVGRDRRSIHLPECDLQLLIDFDTVQGRRLLGVSVAPSSRAKLLADVIQQFTIFALHPHWPYAAYFMECNHIEQDLIVKGYQFDPFSIKKLYTTEPIFF
ncbi:hypothetical protein ABBQ32_011276 [Trebouxia sp. C0010 RCD-2024]